MVLGRFLLNNYKQALRIVSTNTAELNTYRALHLNENLDFGSWVAEELAYLKAVESEPKQDALRVTYVEELERLAKLEYDTVKSAEVILICSTGMPSDHHKTTISYRIISLPSCQARVSVAWPLQLRNKIMLHDVQLSAVSQSVDLGQNNNPNTTPTKDYENVQVVVYLRGVQRGCAEEGERGSTPTG